MGSIILSPKTGSRGLKEHALTYAALGWRVFPVWEMVPHQMNMGAVDESAVQAWKCSCGEGEDCGRPGKHPRLEAGVNEASTDRVKIEGWWTRWPQANIGIATGRGSGMLVVDADCSEGKPGVINLTALSVAGGGMPNTPTVNTGSGGIHLYFLFDERLKTGQNTVAPAIDVRSDGGYVIAPPSRHYSGKLYAWKNDNAELITLPDWLAKPDAGLVPKDKKGRKRVQPGYRLDKVESMLVALDPDDRDLWLKLGVIMGRMYIGTGVEHDAWAVYEAWASRSSKFDEDKSGNLARMREMFQERSQEAPRAGGKELTIGTLISAAKQAGWTPFGKRRRIAWEPGNEAETTDELIEALTEGKDNTFFNVMGEVRDVLRTEVPIVSMIAAAAARGEKPPETLVVRRTSAAGMVCAMAEKAVLETPDKHGAPMAVPIPDRFGAMILKQKAPKFPTLSGVAEWPMVASDGTLIANSEGYDPNTGLYFDIDKTVKIDEKMKGEEAAAFLLEELLADFPFEDEDNAAASLAMLLCFMQRPLMRICPGFGVTAPQPGTGKSTLIELASLAVHGHTVANHAFTDDEDELRKAIHSLMLAKMPAVLFDNIGRGKTIDSDHLAKLLTSEMSTDRTLGASETRKEVNTLLVAFTGNNIAFAHDMATRVVQIRLNAKTANPLRRNFKHKNLLVWAKEPKIRNKVLSACVAIIRAGLAAPQMDGNPSRFAEFDHFIVRPVFSATGLDARNCLDTGMEADNEEDADLRAALELIERWQMKWRTILNGRHWRTTELIQAIEAKTFDEQGIKIIQRAVNDPKAWETNLPKAVGYMLRTLNGDHKFEPLLLTSKMDTSDKVNKWFIAGGAEIADPKAKEGF